MKKLKKLSKNKKFYVVIFYGPFAVGKYTVANEFQKQTGYKFFHNHHVFDIARSLFERNTIHISRLYENLNFAILKEIADAKINAITTHAFSANYVSHSGLSDQNYMKKIESIIKKAGGTTFFIHLKADANVLLKRVIGNSRKKFLKLKDPEIFKGILNDKAKDWTTSASVKNNIIIDNSRLSPRQVVKKVKELIKL